MFRHGGTSERDVGAPLMPFNALAAHRPSRKAYHEQNANPWLAMASGSRRATDECAVPPLDIGVGAIQLSPYRAGVAGQCHTRLLTSPAFPSCSCSLPFRSQVRWVASKSSALNFGHLGWQFAPCIPRRTLTPHPAQAAHRKFKVSDRTPFDRCSRVTFTRMGIELFPWMSARLLVLTTSHPATSAPFQVGYRPIRQVMDFPVPFGCRHSLLGRPVPLGYGLCLAASLLPGQTLSGFPRSA